MFSISNSPGSASGYFTLKSADAGSTLAASSSAAKAALMKMRRNRNRIERPRSTPRPRAYRPLGAAPRTRAVGASPCRAAADEPDQAADHDQGRKIKDELDAGGLRAVADQRV